ncbi:hypothetical protein F5K01_05455 [Streptococcus agalactiae]|nr:hypothetical protein F5K01_05455 [Streptococcus agalactiae]
MGLTSCLFRHSQYSPFRLFIVFLRLTSTTSNNKYIKAKQYLKIYYFLKILVLFCHLIMWI